MRLSEIFKAFESADNEISLEHVLAELAPYKIALYGAGSAGIAFMSYLSAAGVPTECFSDGDPAKWGKKLEGLEIVAPEDIKRRLGENALVIVTINTDGVKYCKSFSEALKEGGHSGVHKRLHDVGCQNVVDYSYFRRCYALFTGDKYNLPSCSDVYAMTAHKSEIERAYELMGDELSRETFLKIVEFRLLDDSVKVPTLGQENQYFERDIYRPIAGEIFVDCGAYDGITLKAFTGRNKTWERYFAIEPDEENYAKLEQACAKLEKVTPIKCAVGAGEGRATLYSLKGPGSFLSGSGADVVPMSTIDKLTGERATMIKMNIEGGELDAMKGAARTITRCAPVLAIAGYHKTWDLWETPLMMKALRPDYKIYLRSYMNHISFIYYAVAEDRKANV